MIIIGAMHHTSGFGMLLFVGACFTVLLHVHMWRVMLNFCTVMHLFQQSILRK